MLDKVKFEVLNIEKANKKDFVKVDVRFENSYKVYNYIRKENYNSKDNNYSVVIDGCRVTFDRNLNYISTIREYNTTGVRKADTSNISKGMTKEVENTLKNIPRAKKEKPEVKIDLENPVKHSKYE